MKAILEFDLPEESPEFLRSAFASSLSSSIFDLDQKLRSIVKYSETETAEAIDAYDKARTFLRDCLRDNNCEFVLEEG